MPYYLTQFCYYENVCFLLPDKNFSKTSGNPDKISVRKQYVVDLRY